MPNFGQALQDFGFGAAGSLVNAGLGLVLGNYNDRRQLAQQQKLQNLQIQGQKQLTDYNFQKQLEMWNSTNYEAQMKHIKGAGLNPALMYGLGGAGGTTANVAQGAVTGANAPVGGREAIDAAAMGMQLQLLRAQKENIEADTANKEANKGNLDADTQNKILAQVITDYTGRELKDTYTRITSPNRNIQAKTYQDELGARQGIAGTIYDLWVDGKLEEKSIAEIEQILLSNAKSRAETANIYKSMDLLEQNIKGAKLDNILKDLETKLQTQTGIDKNSPYWLKIIGRLFVELFNTK